MMPFEFDSGFAKPFSVQDPSSQLYEANWKLQMMSEGYTQKLFMELKNAQCLRELAENKCKHYQNFMMEQKEIIGHLQVENHKLIAENTELKNYIEDLHQARIASPSSIKFNGAGSTTTSIFESSPEHDWPASFNNGNSSFFSCCDHPNAIKQPKPRLAEVPSHSMLSLLSINDNGDNGWSNNIKPSNLFRSTSMEIVSHSQKSQSNVEKTHFLEKAKEMEKILDIGDQASKNNKNEIRLFVGNIVESINEACLKEYFSKYGTVVDSHVPRDTAGKHRGFAYITLTNLKDQNVASSQHIIHGRKVHVDQGQYPKDSKVTQTILVSGIIQNTSNATLVKYFSKYGKVVDFVRHQDSRRKLSRWAMIHFDSVDATKKVLDDEDHMIEGHALDIRCARNFSPSENATLSTKSSKESLNVKKLQISNLHKSTTSETLMKYFGKYGKVLDAYVPTVYGKNQSRNFGYIVMNSEDITFNFYGHHIDGVNVLIENCRSTLAKEITKTILISANPSVMGKLSTDQLIKFFAKFGNIISCRKPNDPFTKKSSHYAFIEYSTTNAVDEAMKNFAYMIDGKLVCITKSRNDQK